MEGKFEYIIKIPLHEKKRVFGAGSNVYQERAAQSHNIYIAIFMKLQERGNTYIKIANIFDNISFWKNDARFYILQLNWIN